MKKLTSLLALVLCLALIAPGAALAQAYVPGQTIEGLIADAWNSGKIIRGELKLRLDADTAALGLYGEEQQIFDAFIPLLDSVTLGFGAGKTESGVRVELDAALAHAQGGTPVTIEGAANVDLYGVTLESDLIPGQRVTAKWETLMAMGGMNDSDIETFIMLRDMDWNALLPQAMAMAEQYLQTAVQYAAPYGQTIAAWAATLNMETQQNVAQEGYPAAATQITISLTEKDLGTLITQLATQLKNDPDVCSVLDMILQEAYVDEGPAPTTVQLCDEMIAEAASMTNTESPILVVQGMDAAGMPLYTQAYDMDGSAVASFMEIVTAPNAQGLYDYAFNGLIFDDAAGGVSNGFSFTGVAGEGQFSTVGQVIVDGEQILGMDYALSTEALAQALPGQRITQAMNMTIVDEGQTVQTVMNGSTTSSLTAEGGEVIDETSTMDMYMDGQNVRTTSLETLSAFPSADGFTGSFSMSQSMPAMGVNAMGVDVTLSCETYDPASTAALKEIAFETSSQADMQALVSGLTSVAQMKAISAMQALPAELLNFLISID